MMALFNVPLQFIIPTPAEIENSCFVTSLLMLKSLFLGNGLSDPKTVENGLNRAIENMNKLLKIGK